MVFVFGFVIGIGFTVAASLTTMLYAAAQVDQALELEFAPPWRETEAATIDEPQSVRRAPQSYRI